MPRYFDFEVSLMGIKPRIWRRFVLRGSGSFLTLHEAIRDACGWSGRHSFAFHALDHYDPDGIVVHVPEDATEARMAPDAAKVRLSEFFGERKEGLCYYQYDFGDDWWHEVLLQRSFVADEVFERRLVGGERAFPPEDCGGHEGYLDCLAMARGEISTDEDPDETRAWLAGWHPEAFNLEHAKIRFDR